MTPFLGELCADAALVLVALWLVLH